MQKVNILVLSHSMPVFPGGAGHEFLHLLHLRCLAAHVGLVSQIHSPSELNAANRLGQAGVELYLYENIAPTTSGPSTSPQPSHARLGSSLRKAGGRLLQLLSREPFDLRFNDLYFRNTAPALLEALAARVWHVLIVVQSNAARTMDYLPSFRNRVLVFHDIRALVFERRARLPIGIWARVMSGINARRYWRFEADYAKRYDECVALSKDDSIALRQASPCAETMVVPIPVDSDYFRRSGRAEDPDLIVFSGMLNHPPNVDAALFLAEEIFPAIRARHKTAKLQIVGKNPTPEIVALARQEGVEITGFVPDIRPYIESAAVVVVPLRFGSGVRNKILEAWSLEKCVVSTTVGAEGLEYSPGKNIVIADSVEEFADAIVALLGDSCRRDAIGARGREIVLTGHQPAVVARDYYNGLCRGVRTRDARPRRLTFDLRWMIPGRAGGLEVLARSFIRELAAFDASDSITLLAAAACAHDFDLRGRSNFRVLSAPSLHDDLRRLQSMMGRRVAGALNYDYWKSPQVETLLWLHRLDAEIVYSFPGYLFPDVRACKHVVMVADIQHEFFPEFFPNGALEERRRLFGDAIAIAEHITVISDYTGQTLIDRLGVPPAKLSTVHLAAAEHFTCGPNPRDARVLDKYALRSGQYLYFPGHTWRHKNHATAIRVLHRLRRDGRDLALVLTGASREANDELLALIDTLHLREHVRFLGFCPHEDIATLYRQAAALIFPSLFEGFGMPVLEAMACGCPVVCSDASSLPEIGGDAPLYAPPLDSETMANHIDAVLGDPTLRSTMVERGIRRSAMFSWRQHMLETMKVIGCVYRKLYG